VQKAGDYSLCVYAHWAASAIDDVATGYGDACRDASFGTAIGSIRVNAPAPARVVSSSRRWSLVNDHLRDELTTLGGPTRARDDPHPAS
jgi:hypothetical protein